MLQKIINFLHKPFVELMGTVTFFLMVLFCFAPDINFFIKNSSLIISFRSCTAGFGMALLLVSGIGVFYTVMDYVYNGDEEAQEDNEECEEIE